MKSQKKEQNREEEEEEELVLEINFGSNDSELFKKLSRIATTQKLPNVRSKPAK